MGHEPTEFHFATTGIRGKAISQLSIEFSTQAGKAIAQWLKTNELAPKVLIGRDYRKSSDMIMVGVIGGLLAHGIDVTVVLSPIPTPALIQQTIAHKFGAGVTITGSHLPASDNGIILVDGGGNYFKGTLTLDQTETIEWLQLGQLSYLYDFRNDYLAFLTRIAAHFQLQDLQYNVLVDPISGPMGSLLIQLLTDLGCRVHAINAEPDPLISARPSEPKPETLTQTLEIFRKGVFDFGITTDFDGDRVIFITDEGEVISGDYIGTLFAKYFWEADPNAKIVVPINTSSLIEKMSTLLGGRQFEYCEVGAPKIIEKMKEINASFGFEETGKYFFKDLCLYPDSAVSTLILLKILNESGQKLSELISKLPVVYQQKTKVFSPRDKSFHTMELVKKHLDNLLERLGDAYHIEKVYDFDGIRINFTNGSWLLLRQSGTEDNLRIFSESESKEDAEFLNSVGHEYFNFVLNQSS